MRAMVAKVIIVEATKGRGLSPEDPVRTVYMVSTIDGTKIVEIDTHEDDVPGEPARAFAALFQGLT